MDLQGATYESVDRILVIHARDQWGLHEHCNFFFDFHTTKGDFLYLEKGYKFLIKTFSNKQKKCF
jgi:hypothetical protein